METLDLYLKALKEVYGKVEVIVSYISYQYYITVNTDPPSMCGRFSTADISLERALHRSAEMFLSSTNSKSAWTQLNEHIHKGP